MVLAVGKFLGMVDAVMDETDHVQLVIAAQTIRVNNAVRHDFLFDNRHQSIGLGIIYDNGIDPSVAFQNAKNNHFSCRAATTSAFTPSAESNMAIRYTLLSEKDTWCLRVPNI